MIQTICNAYCGENYGSTDFDMLENVRDAILRMTYYWYIFFKMGWFIYLLIFEHLKIIC